MNLQRIKENLFFSQPLRGRILFNNNLETKKKKKNLASFYFDNFLTFIAFYIEIFYKKDYYNYV